MTQDKFSGIVDSVCCQLAAGVVTVWVAIEIGGEVIQMGFQLPPSIQRGTSMVQIGDTCSMVYIGSFHVRSTQVKKPDSFKFG